MPKTLTFRTRSMDTLVLTALALCLAGSSIYVPAPLRPFHWGLALFSIVLLIDPAWRAAAWRSWLRTPLIIAVLLLAIQPLWIETTDRYVRYVIYFAISAGSALLGETLARRGKPFLFMFPWLLAFWFITAYFPVFDAWTGAQRFRPTYPLTGGAWDNINDMATVLVFANLIWFLCRRRLSLLLFGACWFYALLLNRRADVAAILVLGVAYLLCFVEGNKLHERLKMLAVWLLTTVAALMLTNETLRMVTLPSIEAKAPVAAVAVATLPASVPPPSALTTPEPAPPSAAAPTPVPLSPAAPPVADSSPPAVPPAQAAPQAAPDPRAPAAAVNITAQGNDESTAFRVRLAMDMLAEARVMPWWQWMTGLGAGQLDLTWPRDNAPWASPHFFWLEMFFHVGLLWFVLLAWLMLRLDWRGRLALLVAGMAGMAPSSMVYFQPFWVFLGVLAAGLPRHGVFSRRSP